MAYSIDFIKSAVAYKQKGHTFTQLRETFGIPSATFYDWEEKLYSGYYNTKIKRERKRKIDKDELRREIQEKPDTYLRELAERYSCTESAIFYALKKLNITRKKRLLPILKNQNRSGRSMPQG
jgi:transposase